MLSDAEIKNLLGEKRIVIDPYDEQYLKPSSYDVHLGNVFLKPDPIREIDLRKGILPTYSKAIIPENEGILIAPKEFILGQTLEKFTLDDDIGAFIDGSSTLARIGVSVHQSSTFLIPGQNEQVITLEIFNAGVNNIRIYPGEKMGKLIFFESNIKNTRSYKDYGKYAGQKEVTGSKADP